MVRTLNSGERLKEERGRVGLNQAQLATIAGVSKTTQFNYEKGDRTPDISYLAAISSAGLDIFYIVTGQRMVNTTELTGDEAEILAHYRAINNDADKGTAQRLIAALAKP